jgi:hypothetical protein
MWQISTDCFVTWITYCLTHCMEQSPSSEANHFAASDGIIRVLWNPEVHYGIKNLTWHVVIRSQLNPVRHLISHYLEIHYIFTSKSGSPKWSLSLRSRQHNTVYNSPEGHDNFAYANTGKEMWQFHTPMALPSVAEEFPHPSWIREHLKF